MVKATALQLQLFNARWIQYARFRPRTRPNDRWSAAYCLWLSKSPRQRFEVLHRQGFKCWECGLVLTPRYMHLHHPNGYANLGYEEATDLAAVHPACHRRIHERIKDAMERWRQQEACGCKAA